MKTISNCLFPSKTYILRIRLKKRKKTTFPSLSISPKSVERQWMKSLLHWQLLNAWTKITEKHCQVTAIKYKEAITEKCSQSTATSKHSSKNTATGCMDKIIEKCCFDYRTNGPRTGVTMSLKYDTMCTLDISKTCSESSSEKLNPTDHNLATESGVQSH